MKKTLYLFLLGLISACASADTMTPLAPLTPHNTLEGTAPTTHDGGAPITDLVSIDHDCGGVTFSTALTTPGAAFSEPLPAGVLALTGAVTCTSVAVTAGGEVSLPSNPSNRWVEGGNAYDSQPAACDGSGCYSAAPAHCEPGVGCFAAVPVYCDGGVCFDEPRPNPPVLGDGGQAGGGGTSALSLAAAGLSPGQTLLFSQTPQRDPTFEDLKWQSVTYHDPIHGRILLIGKAAGATVPHWWSVYDEASDTWSAPQDFITGANGHVYGGITVDPTTGDFYFKEYGAKFLRVLDADTLTWSQTSTWVIANTSTVPHSSTVYHPNLYGAGDGGVVIDTGFGAQPVIGWRKATDTWAIITSPGSPGRTGQGAYFAALDVAVNGGSDNAGNAGILVSPGPSAAAGTTFPLRIAGDTFGNTNIGALMQSPTDPAKMWIVQNGDTVNDGRRVYESTDAETWTQIADHPFVVAEGGIWVSMPEYGVVGFIDANDGTFWLWKP